MRLAPVPRASQQIFLLQSRRCIPHTLIGSTLQLTALAPRIKELRQRQEQLQMSGQEFEMLLSDRRVELADLEAVTRYVADLHNLLNDSTPANRKSFIKSFVSEVRVTGTEVLFGYNFPFLGDRLSHETIRVPRIAQRGGRYRT